MLTYKLESLGLTLTAAKASTSKTNHSLPYYLALKPSHEVVRIKSGGRSTKCVRLCCIGDVQRLPRNHTELARIGRNVAPAQSLLQRHATLEERTKTALILQSRNHGPTIQANQARPFGIGAARGRGPRYPARRSRPCGIYNQAIDGDS
jgi:hypothetical protein